MYKRKISALISLLAIVVLFSSCGKTSPSQTGTSDTSSTADTKTVRLQDDFYEHVNQEWLKGTTLGDDVEAISAFTEIDEKITTTLQNDFDKMLAGSLEPTTQGTTQFLDFYQMMLDVDKRNKDGAAPLLTYLEKVENISSLEDLSNVIGEFTISGMPLPMNISIIIDMKNSEKNLLVLDSPSILLPDKSYYEEGNQEGQKKIKEYEKSYSRLLTTIGKTEDEAAAMVKNYFKIDKLIAQSTKSGEEASDLAGYYNPYAISDVNSTIKTIDFSKAMEEIIGEVPETIIVANPKFLENMHLIINEENLQSVKDWMYIDFASQSSDYLSEEIAKAESDEAAADNADDYDKEIKRKAYENASELFQEAIGVYYGQTYLGEEAKKDVTQMTENMISLYAERLKEVDWLSEKTKENAIKKLDTMVVQIGYPDHLPAYYDHLSIDTEKSAFDNMMAIQKAVNQSQFSVYSEGPNRKEWTTHAHEVNAAYDPQANSICFPAAILQDPFYHVEHSRSKNYGGIGAVIGHELSHAFDTNGAKFDEKGNLHNWWTKEDYEAFEKKAQTVIDQFDGIEFSGGKVNGKLTVSENIADSSGLSIALGALKKEKEPNLEEFFTNWAAIWRKKISPETSQELLLVDPHSPSKLRANIQLTNLEDFHTTFGIKEGDGMYLAPEERTSVW